MDRYGIELAVIRPDGVDRFRLQFPDGPIRDLDQLSTGLRIPLTCHCDDHR